MRGCSHLLPSSSSEKSQPQYRYALSDSQANVLHSYIATGEGLFKPIISALFKELKGLMLISGDSSGSSK